MFFELQHDSYLCLLFWSVLIAQLVNLDNRFIGPYFAIADVVFNEFGAGYKWNDKEIIVAFARRTGLIIMAGVGLRAIGYEFHDIGAVFLTVGFLAIWPAFPPRPLPVYVNKRGWHVWLVWTLYVTSVTAFGTFGALIISPQDLKSAIISLGVALFATTIKVPVQRSMQSMDGNRGQKDRNAGR